MLNVFNTDYKQLQYSSSYSGTVNGRAIIHDLSFCMPLVDALMTLVRQNYQSFLLTIECSTVYWVAYGKPSRNLCLISWVFLLSCLWQTQSRSAFCLFVTGLPYGNTAIPVGKWVEFLRFIFFRVGKSLACHSPGKWRLCA